MLCAGGDKVGMVRGVAGDMGSVNCIWDLPGGKSYLHVIDRGGKDAGMAHVTDIAERE